MSDDPELEAIRARLRQQMMAEAAAPAEEEAAPPLDRPVEVDDAGFDALVREHDLLVVDCWAPWCGPCRIVGPVVDELAREMAGRVAFAKLNVDHNPRVSNAFAIQSIPTLLVFKRGRLVDRIVGALPKARLQAAIERHASPRRAGTPGPRRL